MDVTADDKKLLAAIMDAAEPEQLAARVFDYYHDSARAERTSRAQMYLHMGMLAGAILRALNRQRMPVIPSGRKDRGAVMRVEPADRAFIRFAKRATAGIDRAGLMLGLLDERGKGTPQWYGFALQIGVCLLNGKPVLLVVPHGTTIPDKLRAAAAAVEFYTPGDMTSCELATKRALLACGLPVRH